MEAEQVEFATHSLFRSLPVLAIFLPHLRVTIPLRVLLVQSWPFFTVRRERYLKCFSFARFVLELHSEMRPSGVAVLTATNGPFREAVLEHHAAAGRPGTNSTSVATL
jgi:hypothetical protein